MLQIIDETWLQWLLMTAISASHSVMHFLHGDSIHKLMYTLANLYVKKTVYIGLVVCYSMTLIIH